MAKAREIAEVLGDALQEMGYRTEGYDYSRQGAKPVQGHFLFVKGPARVEAALRVTPLGDIETVYEVPDGFIADAVARLGWGGRVRDADIDELAKDMVADGGHPNVWFITQEGAGVIATALSKREAIARAKKLGEARPVLVEDRVHGEVWGNENYMEYPD